MANNKITLGVSNFRKLVSSDNITADLNKLFVDKTLFIKNFLDHSNEVVWITRPRRWGKSLALSMLDHFFRKEVHGFATDKLFNNLQISQYLQDERYKKYRGTYPVILVSFKDLQIQSFNMFTQGVAEIISKLYREHDYLLAALQSQQGFKFKTTQAYKSLEKEYVKIMAKEANLAELTSSLKNLSALLHQYFGNKVFILIDEYDNALNRLFTDQDLQKKLTDFFSSLFGSCLKT